MRQLPDLLDQPGDLRYETDRAIRLVGKRVHLVDDLGAALRDERRLFPQRGNDQLVIARGNEETSAVELRAPNTELPRRHATFEYLST